MKDLTQCAIFRDDFREWLNRDSVSLEIRSSEESVTTLFRLAKKPHLVDYLYRSVPAQDGSVSWNTPLLFCGVYDLEKETLYLTEDSLPLLAKDPAPYVVRTIPSMADEIMGRINQRVEAVIANDRGNLPVLEVTDRWALKDLEYYRNYTAREIAIRNFFAGQVPDGQFHSGYALDELPEAAFMAWLQNPEMFIQTEAEQYIKSHQEEFLVDFLQKEALLAEYQALIQDAGSPIHRMKAITEAVRKCGARTVTVTVQKVGEELTFKAAADSLTGYRPAYRASELPAPDRREFVRRFGRIADYSVEEITRITYGRNTIYEAPPVQSKNMSEETNHGIEMKMEGM